MSDKKFPKGIYPKVVNTSMGTITKISIKKKEFIDYLNSLDEKELYLNLDIIKRPVPTEKSTHYIVVDEWKPKPKEVSTKPLEINNGVKDDLFTN
jgi:hypothetical protein